MKITLVGTGTGIPSSLRNSPCILAEMGKRKALFDSGPGSLKNILPFNTSYLDLDSLFYTHLHLDHISDLSVMLFSAKIPPAIREKPLTVYGPNGLKKYYEGLKDLYKETILTDAYRLHLEEIENKEIELEGFRISTMTLEHHGGGMGYRITTPENKVAVYSGDTGYCKEIVELSRDADLLVLECSSPGKFKMKGHLTPSTAGRVAQEANAKRLVFVHMYPVCEEFDLVSPCRNEYKGEIVVGKDSMQFQI